LAAAEKIPAAHHQGHLDAALDQRGDLRRRRRQRLFIDAEMPRPGHRLAGELQHDSFVLWLGIHGSNLPDSLD
jgi:hypothetical protein